MRHDNSRTGVIAVVVLILPPLLYFKSEVAAHSGAKGFVKMRMETMKSIGAQMKILGKIAKDPTRFDAELVSSTAKELSEHAAKIPELFPKGSNHKPSEARNEIWSDWDKFLAFANELKQAVDDLQKTSAETFKPAFLKAANACTNCHQEFRQKKN